MPSATHEVRYWQALAERNARHVRLLLGALRDMTSPATRAVTVADLVEREQMMMVAVEDNQR